MAPEGLEAVSASVLPGNDLGNLSPPRAAESGAVQHRTGSQGAAPDADLAEVIVAWLTWNGGTVRKIAEVIYERRAFQDLSILADALEEAGCDDPPYLTTAVAQSLTFEGVGSSTS
jgi:hypothetical protein